MVQSDVLGPGTAQLMSNLKESSIKIGEGPNKFKLNCVTENSDQYNQPITNNAQTTINKTKNQELKTYLKGHHFDFGIKSVKSGGIYASHDT